MLGKELNSVYNKRWACILQTQLFRFIALLENCFLQAPKKFQNIPLES